jgi:hypothetical protein
MQPLLRCKPVELEKSKESMSVEKAREQSSIQFFIYERGKIMILQVSHTTKNSVKHTSTTYMHQQRIVTNTSNVHAQSFE